MQCFYYTKYLLFLKEQQKLEQYWNSKEYGGLKINEKM